MAGFGSRLRLGLVAGLYGNLIDAVAYRRGYMGRTNRARCLYCPNVDEPPADDPDELTDSERHRNEVERTLDQYATSGRFTAIELRTLRALSLEHESFRSIAQREGVSVQAVRARI